MKRIYILAALLLYGLPSLAQPTAAKRIVLIGNTYGDISLLQALSNATPLDSNTTVVFLGNDMSHENGKRLHAMEKFLASGSSSGVKVVCLPGHRDWKQAIRTQQKDKAASSEKKEENPYPLAGCPGPASIDISDDAKLVLMDTQWWLEEDEKPGMESDCPCRNEQQVMDKLEDIVSDNRDKLIIFAAHHPFHTTGIRSGYFGPKQHIFPLTDIRGMRHFWLPLPVVGSFYPLMRGVAISRQDMGHSAYGRMITSLDPILQEHPFLIRAAAHEHVLQLYENDGQYYITSGAAERAGRVVRTRHTPYVSRSQGLSVIEITPDKKASAIFYELENGKLTQAYRKELLNFRERPPIQPAEAAHLAARSGDSVSAAVFARYGKASGMKRFFYGNNYRREWSTPVTLPQFHIAEDPRQFKIDGQGGGKQTTTIRLKDKDGKVWSLRSIVKDPEKVLAPALRGTIAEDAMKDMMSASHPFAAVVSNGLSAAAGIVHPRVEYYFVPDDTALGYYRPAFANTIVALEERQPSRHGEETESSWKVINGHLDKWKDKVDARSYLRARLLDILLADFDRHYEQWKWGEEKTGDTKTWYAIPKDRDQALFYSDGLLMKLGAKQGFAYMKGLQSDIANITSLGFVSRDIDAFFLNELTAADWEDEISKLKNALTDQTIQDAVASLPKPAYAAHGRRIEERLKSRRDALPERGMQFYHFLATQVSVVGSGRDEVFNVSREGDGIALTVTNKDGEPRYRRIFNTGETEQVYMYGFGGNDSFRIAPEVPRGIRFRAVGGGGQDVFDMQGRAKNFVYDNADGGNEIVHRSHTTNFMSHRRDVNSYTFRENHYSSVTYPSVQIGFNIDDGFMAGLGAHFTRRGFRASPFTTQHRLTSLVAFEHRAYQLRYAGTFNNALRSYDLLANAALLNPALQNFFGLGNETSRDTSLPLSYYRVRYSYVSADLMLRKRAVHNKLSVALGPSVFYYWNNNDRNAGRILDYATDYGLDSSRIFSPKFYGGGKLTIDFNSIDNILLPTRGIQLHVDGVAQTGLNEATLPYYRAQGALSMYAPLSSNKRFVVALRGGGGHIFSDSFEYWQALTLGANNYLRGYRKNRFSGSSMAYGSAELRWRIARFRARFMPGDLGLVGFQDVGRVWMRGERSDKWHTATGGGIYFTPFNAVLLSVLGAVSEEEQLVNVSIGMGLNITF